MTNPDGCSHQSKRKLTIYLQSFYARKTQWLIPLPWKQNFRFLFDQAYVKDIRLHEKIHQQLMSICKQDLTTARSFDRNSTFNIIDFLSGLKLRIVTIGGPIGSGKSVFVTKMLRDWVRGSNNNKLCLHADLTKYNSNFENLSLNDVLSIFNIPDYLCGDFIWMIENNGHDIMVVIETNDICSSSRVIFKLFYKVFPCSKFLIFHRPEYADKFKDLLASQEYYYLLKKRIKFRINPYEVKETLSFVKQLSFNPIVFQNFRDSLHEHKDLQRLCSSPFICMVILQLYKETKGLKFIENKLMFFRKILIALWKRYSITNHCKSDRDIIHHIDSLLITLSEYAVQCYTTVNYYQFPEHVLIENEHTTLLLDSGLFIEHRMSNEDDADLEDNIFYTFFDPMLHEYTCALYFNTLITEQNSTRNFSEIKNMLFSPDWSRVCSFVAGLLGKQFHVLLQEIDFRYIDDISLSLIADGLFQCQCPKLCLQNVPKTDLPVALDFSELSITSSTLKGLQVLVDWANDAHNNNCTCPKQQNDTIRRQKSVNYQKLAHEKILQSKYNLNYSNYDYRSRDTEKSVSKHHHKYNSCPDLNMAFSSISLKADTDILADEQSWGSQYQAHITKQRSMANLSLLSINKQKNDHMHLNQARSSIFSFPRHDLSMDQLNMLGRFDSALSLSSSMESLLNTKTNFAIKELRLKGHCLGNRTFASLISFLRTNPVERLFLMDPDEDVDGQYFISPKLVTKLLEVIQSSIELSLNSNVLGFAWVDRLVDLILDNTSIKYLSLAILDLEDLNVENALKLSKAFNQNKLLEQVELFCGVQSIVIQTSLGYFVDILERDRRINVVFL